MFSLHAEFHFNDLATYIYISRYGWSEHIHHPVLILKAAKKTRHLPRNICDNIATAIKKVCRLGMIITNFREKFNI